MHTVSEAPDRTNAVLEEYSSEQAVLKYSKKSAGNGIDYLLEHDYGDIYRSSLKRVMPLAEKNGLRFIEFGCGAGMNLIHITSLLGPLGITLNRAYGTDFSQKLIQAANSEAAAYLQPSQRPRVQFCTARNETLATDLAAAASIPKSDLLGSFHFIIGVNTIRYCHRLHQEVACVKDIFDLLVPGGIAVVIDMNRGFPFFRTRLRDKLTKPAEEVFLPGLAEYAAPFGELGFQIIEKRHFCWIPHSASPILLRACRLLTPVLNTVVPGMAMRCLVVARKPV